MGLIKNILGKKNIEPIYKKERYKCPFYGFYMGPGILMDQDGNQCAFINGSYSPCQMEIRKKIPNWKGCQFNNQENKEIIDKITDSFKVDAKEFRPSGKKSWEGMSIKDWIGYVMKESEN